MRDTITIGTSAGGVEALPRLLAALEPDLAASIFVVQHLSASHDAFLVEIVQRRTRLPICWAEQGARIELGHVYIAPPDHHLTIAEGHLCLDNGPHEIHSRPSIDRLFRSAALRGSRVIGVLLTGMLHDGVAGLQEIRKSGGLVIVQDPADAQFPELPTQALRAIQPDYILDLAAIGPALARLVTSR
jgi:two-component system, chemotaxis family, protein-glutamate methylesterase/glutaminase